MAEKKNEIVIVEMPRRMKSVTESHHLDLKVAFRETLEVTGRNTDSDGSLPSKESLVISPEFNCL